MNGVINLHFLTLLTQTMEDTISFCKSTGLIPNAVKCPNCKRLLEKLYSVKRSNCDSHEIRYQCNRKVCRGRGKRNSVSIKKGTWFGDCKLNIKKSDIMFCVSNVICCYNA